MPSPTLQRGCHSGIQERHDEIHNGDGAPEPGGPRLPLPRIPRFSGSMPTTPSPASLVAEI
jgi:hypothetical protein